MNIKQSVRCQMQMDSRWAQLSAIFMGLFVFLRAVYYLGFTNLRDLSKFQLTSELVLPLAVAMVFLVLLKGLKLNSPILFGILSGLCALDYLLVMEKGEIVSAVLLTVNAVLFLAVVFGILHDSGYVMLAGAVSVFYRVVIVDLLGYIFPLSDFHPIHYLPLISNLFAVLSIGALSPALQVTQRRKQQVGEADISAEGHI